MISSRENIDGAKYRAYRFRFVFYYSVASFIIPGIRTSFNFIFVTAPPVSRRNSNIFEYDKRAKPLQNIAESFDKN